MTTKTRVSLEEYLRLPETAPYFELVDGEVVQKTMPNASHAAIVAELLAELIVYLRKSREGRALTELRHTDRAEEWVFLPDISVTLNGRWPAPPADMHGPVEVMPDFAIEVLSPDDQSGRVQQKIAHYMRSGVTLLWIVDPESEIVTVWRQGHQPTIVSGGKLSAEPVLAAFEIDLDALFATLHS